jgi:HK97 family phage major capsid protein
MAANLKQLLEERAELITEAAKKKAAFDAEKRAATDEDVKYFTDSAAKRSELENQIKFLQAIESSTTPVETTKPAETRAATLGKEDANHEHTANLEEEKRAKEAAAKGPSPEQRNMAFKGWVMARAGLDLEDEHRTAARACNIRMGSGDLDIRLFGSYPTIQRRFYEGRTEGREQRALSNLNLALGGALVPEGFINELEIALLAYGGMREVSRVLRTDMGNPLPMPTVNDTTNKATLIAENTTVSEKDISLQQITFSAYKFTSGLVQVPVELMQDSAFNLESYVGELLGIRMARGLNDFYTTGTGASQPNGVITAASTTVAAINGTSIVMDDVLNLIHGVDPMYRPGAVFMCHDSVKLALRQLKDGMGRYMWQDGDVKAGIPEQLFGYPVYTNQSMQSVLVSGKTSFSSGNLTLLFGEMKKFIIREVAGVRLLVLRERYADSDQIAFVAFMRADSNLIDAGTHPVKVLKH